MMGICFFFAIFAERMFGKNSWIAVSLLILSPKGWKRKSWLVCACLFP